MSDTQISYEEEIESICKLITTRSDPKLGAQFGDEVIDAMTEVPPSTIIYTLIVLLSGVIHQMVNHHFPDEQQQSVEFKTDRAKAMSYAIANMINTGVTNLLIESKGR